MMKLQNTMRKMSKSASMEHNQKGGLNMKGSLHSFFCRWENFVEFFFHGTPEKHTGTFGSKLSNIS
jgi:hypothetical protein